MHHLILELLNPLKQKLIEAVIPHALLPGSISRGLLPPQDPGCSGGLTSAIKVEGKGRQNQWCKVGNTVRII